MNGLSRPLQQIGWLFLNTQDQLLIKRARFLPTNTARKTVPHVLLEVQPSQPSFRLGDAEVQHEPLRRHFDLTFPRSTCSRFTFFQTK